MNMPTGSPENEQADLSEPPPTHFVLWLWRHTRRIVVFIVGSTVLLIGVLMIIGPGPAVIVIPLGLAILATEFVWARRWLAYAKRHLEGIRKRKSVTPDSYFHSGRPMKSRTEAPPDYPPRLPVAEAQADWKIPFTGYAPPSYTAESVVKLEGTLADPADVRAVSRPLLTHAAGGDHPVKVDANGRPLNPIGRTGLGGRGRLRRWGRNQAVDAVLTRLDPLTGHPQVLLIERGDNHQLALPGGMVDPGETMEAAASRELREETGLVLGFQPVRTIYAGIVDDPRNTDHAWMETTVFHRHLTESDIDLKSLQAGDDAAAVKWHNIHDELISSMYASHGLYVRLAADRIQTAV